MPAHLRLVRSRNLEPEAQIDANLISFLAELTSLSERYGIAISDGAELFEMEPDDRLSAYRADADSRLSRA